jgi:hypothetical protein
LHLFAARFEPFEIQAPVLAAIRCIVESQNDRHETRPLQGRCLFEITGLDTVNVNVFFLGHVFVPPFCQWGDRLPPLYA